MADKVTIWFDAEADYLEVQFMSGLTTIVFFSGSTVM
jgi:hypothetical protein